MLSELTRLGLSPGCEALLRSNPKGGTFGSTVVEAAPLGGREGSLASTGVEITREQVAVRARQLTEESVAARALPPTAVTGSLDCAARRHPAWLRVHLRTR
jgi:hypothetical protein